MAPGSYKTCHRPDMAYGLQFADPVNIFFITMTKRKQLCKDHLKVILNLSAYSSTTTKHTNTLEKK